MNLRIIRLITLIIGSIVVIFTLEGAIFVGANYLADLGGGDYPHSFLETLQLLCILMPIAAIIIAWFKNRLGGILVTLSGALLFLEPGWWTAEDIFWQPYALIVVGLVLMYVAFRKK